MTDDLVYVSPKSGRAVSAEAGAPWRDRLLPLPPFLREDAPLEAQPSAEEIADGFRLTGFFLARDLFALHGEPLPDSAGRLSQGGSAGALERVAFGWSRFWLLLGGGLYIQSGRPDLGFLGSSTFRCEDPRL